MVARTRRESSDITGRPRTGDGGPGVSLDLSRRKGHHAEWGAAPSRWAHYQNAPHPLVLEAWLWDLRKCGSREDELGGLAADKVPEGVDPCHLPSAHSHISSEIRVVGGPALVLHPNRCQPALTDPRSAAPGSTRPEAAVTNFHQLGGFKQKKMHSLTVLGARIVSAASEGSRGDCVFTLPASADSRRSPSCG